MLRKDSARAAANGTGALRPATDSRRTSTTNRPGGRARPQPSTPGGRGDTLDFAAINRTALPVLLDLLRRWLPGGRRQGNEYLALNPHRADQHLGSFKVNVATGRWADFATGDRGGDPVSLLAFLEGCSQTEAARQLVRRLAMEGGR